MSTFELEILLVLTLFFDACLKIGGHYSVVPHSSLLILLHIAVDLVGWQFGLMALFSHLLLEPCQIHDVLIKFENFAPERHFFLDILLILFPRVGNKNVVVLELKLRVLDILCKLLIHELRLTLGSGPAHVLLRNVVILVLIEPLGRFAEQIFDALLLRFDHLTHNLSADQVSILAGHPLEVADMLLVGELLTRKSLSFLDCVFLLLLLHVYRSFDVIICLVDIGVNFFSLCGYHRPDRETFEQLELLLLAEHVLIILKISSQELVLLAQVFAISSLEDGTPLDLVQILSQVCFLFDFAALVFNRL